ncbi:hypothetical protein Tco_0199304 [Tanacetum coccineum]
MEILPEPTSNKLCGLDIAHAVGVMSRYMVEPDLTVKGYVDSDYAGDLDGKYVATAQANKESVWLKMLLEDLRTKQEKITPFCDNYSALYLARNPTFHSKIKHIRVQYHFVCENVEEGTVDM